MTDFVPRLSDDQLALVGAILEHGPHQEQGTASAAEAATVLGLAPRQLRTHARAIGALERAFMVRPGEPLTAETAEPYANGGAAPNTSVTFFAGTEPEGMATFSQTSIECSWAGGNFWVITL